MPAWTFKGRNDDAAGQAQDVARADIPNNATPAPADTVLGYKDADGSFQEVPISSLVTTVTPPNIGCFVVGAFVGPGYAPYVLGQSYAVNVGNGTIMTVYENEDDFTNLSVGTWRLHGMIGVVNVGNFGGFIRQYLWQRVA